MYEIIESKVAFDGKIIDVIHDKVVIEENREVMREVVKHVGAATILPVDENGDIYFVRQYRHPAKQKVLEIPAGTLEPNEKPEVCAYRELEEEIGYVSSNITFLTKIYPAVGYSSEVIHIYLAKDLVQTAQNLDPDEFVEIEKYSLKETLKLIKDGEIIDSKTIIAILFYKEFCTV